MVKIDVDFNPRKRTSTITASYKGSVIECPDVPGLYNAQTGLNHLRQFHFNYDGSPPDKSLVLAYAGIPRN